LFFKKKINSPQSLSSTFAQLSIGNFYPGNFEYSRSSNPTRDTLESLISSLEVAKHGVTFSCGLGAITAVLNLLKSGDHILSMNDIYRGTGRSISNLKNSHKIESNFVDFTKDSWKEFITKETKMVWIESPTKYIFVFIET
jgi:cystathionine beta-lyase/cystathionine gamma-synthase